jgi:hypothetical protein
MNNLLRHRCAIERRDAVQASASGETIQNWQTIADGVPCLLDAKGGSARQGEYGRTTPVNFVGFFRWMTDLQVDDRIVVNDQRYAVTFLADRSGHHIEADLALVIAP